MYLKNYPLFFILQEEASSELETFDSPPEYRSPSRSTTNSTCDLDTPSTSSLPPRKQKKKAEIECQIDNVITSVGKHLTEVRAEDKHDVFGKNVAHKLRNLPEHQRIYLEKNYK